MSRFSFRPQVESLDERCLPSVNPVVNAIGDVALVAPDSIPQAVTISITKGFGDFTPGAFSASGEITDSGGYQLIDTHDTALYSPVVGTSHSTISLTGTRWTITMKCETVFRLVSVEPLVFGEDGRWRIVGGTGDYADLKGEGEFHKLIDVSLGQITIALTGQVHSGSVGLGGDGSDNIRRDADNDLDLLGPQGSETARIDHLMSRNQLARAAVHAEAFLSQDKTEEVTLTLTVDLEEELRTWTAVGAIEDSGTAATVWIQFGAFGAPTKSVLLIDTQFTNTEGTGSFTIRRTVISTADGPDLFLREGTWHIVDATGIYAGLKGHGELTGIESGTLVVDTLTGAFKNAA